MNKVLIIIPARGGSKGIPRKNLRSLADKPLIYYSIKTALALQLENTQVDVFVSSEDEEILTISQKFGAQIIRRNPELSNDKATLDEVICNDYRSVEENGYNLVVTMQPTSPLLRAKSLERAIEKMLNHPEIDSLISATNDSHLTWLQRDGAFVPNYEKRVNRQELPQIFKETGGFLICQLRLMETNSRIGQYVDLFELKGAEAIDIDSYSDWNICEFYLKRKRLLFVVSGYKEIGMGHVYNTLSVANEILNHDLFFLVDNKSELAYQKIAQSNYPVHIQQQDDIVDDIFELNPDIIINDRLDTTREEMVRLREIAPKIINFEDLGSGAEEADLVFNAMYPEQESLPNHYFGLDYFILRDEFLFSEMHEVKEEVKSILLCFGGVDTNDYTARILKLLHESENADQLTVKVIVGMGYAQVNELRMQYPNLEILINVSNISEYIAKVDLVFTSAGRTTFECASLGTPAIVICQNERETTHFFAGNEYGFKNLGLGLNVSDEAIIEAFEDCLKREVREKMNQRMIASNLKNGKRNVIQKIKNTIDQ